MRPPFNSFRPLSHPQRPQQHQQQNNGYSNHHLHNGYQNQGNANQFGMMNPPQMMSNPMMGHMNNPIPMPNMPIPPQFFNNMQPQQQQQHQFGLPNNINHLLPSLLGNLQFAIANNNLMAPLAQPNFLLPPSAFTSQPQLNSFNSHSYPPPPQNPHQNHQFHPRPQGQPGRIMNNNNRLNSNGNGFRNKSTKHQKSKGPGQGFQRPQSHQANNAKKKDHMDKDNNMATGVDGTDNAGNIAEKKKSVSSALFYTPKEIKQWRAARRKNCLAMFNVEKKGKTNISEHTLEEEAKLRRQQLREVLAKQAELGVEVAEVYLSNTNEQLNGDRGDFHYKGGEKGRDEKKRKHGDRRKFSKKPKFENQNSSQESSLITRKPTLLEKLGSPDIKREKSQLLQVFRFMVKNSFFKEFPQQPLKVPLVEETGSEHDREDPTNDDGDVDLNSDDEAVEG